MPTRTRGSRPTFVGVVNLAKLYQCTVRRTRMSCVRLCELLAEHVHPDDRAAVDAALTRATRYLTVPNAGRSRSAENIVLRRAGLAMSEQVTGDPACIIVALLTSLNQAPTNSVLRRVATWLSFETVALELMRIAYGVRDPQSAALLAAYIGTGYTRPRSLNWLLERVERWPDQGWLVPALIDLVQQAERRADEAGSDTDPVLQIQSEVAELLAAEPLTPAQAEVAYALAYDGNLPLTEIAPTARQLA
jgi:hypothetical protein